jgi:uncharacterized protein YdiU (UPF0061 family)
MNTDNMSILGLTIDYGPYSFLDDYDPAFTPNTTDLPGRRYAFGKQSAIAKWNLGALGGAVATLLDDTEPLLAALNSYDDVFWKKYYEMMGNKLGLDEVVQEDIQLINQLERVLASLKPDMTIFFQELINMPASLDDKAALVQHFDAAWYGAPASADGLQAFLVAYAARL